MQTRQGSRLQSLRSDHMMAVARIAAAEFPPTQELEPLRMPAPGIAAE